MSPMLFNGSIGVSREGESGRENVCEREKERERERESVCGHYSLCIEMCIIEAVA